MRKAVFVMTLLCSLYAFAHDEGHGPKLTDTGKQGGIVAPVIEAKGGHHAKVLYKSELVRGEDGKISLYLYDAEMNPVNPGKFSAKGIIETKKKGKASRTPFSLSAEENVFVASPKVTSKPFNLEILLKEGNKELLTAFQNLD